MGNKITIMDNIKKLVTKTAVLRFICFTSIIAWPVYNSFLGLDLVDTGYYMYQYDTPLSVYGAYTTYLATLIGAVWLKIFPGLGLWGLNLLELFLEWTTCFIVYQTFKGRFGKNVTLCGIAITMVAISTYVNIFNYHQLNMALCCIMLCFMYKSLSENKKYVMFLAGCVGMLAVMCRMPSILTLVCLLCIIYWNIRVERTWKGLCNRILLFLLGYVVVGATVFLFLYRVGLIDIIFEEIFRLNNLGNTSSPTYGALSMFINFVNDTFWGMAAALLFTGCMLGFALLNKWRRTPGKWKSVIFGMYTIVMLPFIYVAVYVVGQAPPFIQVTSFSWFLYGICVLVTLYYMIKGLISSSRREQEDGVIAMMAIALILLCVVGSAARVKHTILGLWIIVPFLSEKLKDLYRNSNGIQFKILFKKRKISLSQPVLKQTVLAIVCTAVVCFVHFLAFTNNFDSTNRRKLVATVESDKLKYIRTTSRQAESVNEILEELDGNKDTPLMVLGNAVMFYYLTDMDSYVRPWVSGTSYTYDRFTGDMWYRVGLREKRPIILLCKTELYRGFSEKDYENLRASEEKNNYGGKKEFVYEFMGYYEYEKVYENDYFILYEPNKDRELQIWR